MLLWEYFLELLTLIEIINNKVIILIVLKQLFYKHLFLIN